MKKKKILHSVVTARVMKLIRICLKFLWSFFLFVQPLLPFPFPVKSLLYDAWKLLMTRQAGDAPIPVGERIAEMASDTSDWATSPSVSLFLPSQHFFFFHSPPSTSTALLLSAPQSHFQDVSGDLLASRGRFACWTWISTKVYCCHPRKKIKSPSRRDTFMNEFHNVMISCCSFTK